ncbi:hypothetical protein D3C77_662400 [compost metagenome]
MIAITTANRCEAPKNSIVPSIENTNKSKVTPNPVGILSATIKHVKIVTPHEPNIAVRQKILSY